MGSIAFDHATAQALINALESADERVHHQSMQWSDTVDTAMDEFEGGYARAFSSNADNERRDQSDLCFHLLTVASQVKFAQQDAEAEEQRLAAVAEWERNFAAWEADSTREGSVWTKAQRTNSHCGLSRERTIKQLPSASSTTGSHWAWKHGWSTMAAIRLWMPPEAP